MSRGAGNKFAKWQARVPCVRPLKDKEKDDFEVYYSKIIAKVTKGRKSLEYVYPGELVFAKLKGYKCCPALIKGVSNNNWLIVYFVLFMIELRFIYKI